VSRRPQADTEGDDDELEVEGGHTDALLGPTAAPGEEHRVRLPRLARHTITLPDGHTVGVAVCGQGVPLVVVHGFSAEGFLYAQTLWRLVDMGFKVVAIDTAGHGATQGLPTGGANFDSYRDLLGRVLDTLGIRKAVLVGHSMGGRLVAELAAAQPERVIAVVLVDAIVGRAWDRIVWLSRVFPPLLVGVGGLLVADTLSTVPLFRDPSQAIKLGRLVGPTLVGHARRPWRMLGPAVSIIRSRTSGPALDAIRDARIPLFAVHGEHDIVVPVSTGRDAARRTGGELVVVHGASHSWLLKDPEAMPAIVHQLMRGRLGTAVLRVRLQSGLDLDAPRSALETSPVLYDPDALAVRLTPRQDWRDEARLHRAPRFRWHVERE
jgi:pimeloyl-ACP methyl ester carboxylesterase